MTQLNTRAINDGGFYLSRHIVNVLGKYGIKTMEDMRIFILKDGITGMIRFRNLSAQSVKIINDTILKRSIYDLIADLKLPIHIPLKKDTDIWSFMHFTDQQFLDWGYTQSAIDAVHDLFRRTSLAGFYDNYKAKLKQYTEPPKEPEDIEFIKRQLTDKKRRITERDRKIKQLKSQIEEKANWIAGMGRQQCEKNRRIADLERQLADKNRQLGDQDRRIADLERQLTQANRKMANLVAHIRSLTPDAPAAAILAQKYRTR